VGIERRFIHRQREYVTERLSGEAQKGARREIAQHARGRPRYNAMCIYLGADEHSRIENSASGGPRLVSDNFQQLTESIA
jgi:hypothetical protein